MGIALLRLQAAVVFYRGAGLGQNALQILPLCTKEL